MTPDNLFRLLSLDGTVGNVTEGLLLYRNGSVCDDRFNMTAADAICIELGFLRALRFKSESNSGENSIPYGLLRLARRYRIKLDNVECPERFWDSCSFISGEHDCSTGEKVFLTCTTGKIVNLFMKTFLSL